MSRKVQVKVCPRKPNNIVAWPRNYLSSVDTDHACLCLCQRHLNGRAWRVFYDSSVAEVERLEVFVFYLHKNHLALSVLLDQFPLTYEFLGVAL